MKGVFFLCLFLLIAISCLAIFLVFLIYCQPGLGQDKIKKCVDINERKLKPPPHIPRPPPTHTPWPPLPTLEPSSPSPEPSTTSAPTVTGPPGLCPFPDPECAVHLPHPDPTKFYKCAYGVAFVKECQPPLKFNATLQICDW